MIAGIYKIVDPYDGEIREEKENTKDSSEDNRFARVVGRDDSAR